MLIPDVGRAHPEIRASECTSFAGSIMRDRTLMCICRTHVADTKYLDELSLSDPQAAADAADLLKWRKGSHYANFQALIHALNLQEDPSRGQTHIILRRIAHVKGPDTPRDYRRRVQVTHCSVYRLDDVWDDLPKVFPLFNKPNVDLRAIIHSLQAIFSQKNGLNAAIPMFVITMGDHVSTNLSASRCHTFIGLGDTRLTAAALPPVPAAMDYVKLLRSNPGWRRTVNGEDGPPPQPFFVPSGAPDAEFLF